MTELACVIVTPPRLFKYWHERTYNQIMVKAMHTRTQDVYKVMAGISQLRCKKELLSC